MWDPLRRRAVSVTDSSMRQLGPLDLVLCPSRGVPVTDDMRCEGVEVVVSATTQSGRPLPFDADRPHSTLNCPIAISLSASAFCSGTDA